MKNYSVQSILDWLETKNYLSERRKAEAYVLTDSNINKLPMYIHVLMGIGAIIGCFCIIGLLAVADIISMRDSTSLLISSGVSIAISLVSFYLLRYQTLLLQSFGLQCSLVFMIVGKVLFVLGFSELPQLQGAMHGDWIWTLGILIVTVPTYFLYPMQIDRFLSTLALLLSLLNNSVLYSTTNIGLFIYFVALILFCGFLYLWRNKSLAWVPLGYAAVLTLLASSLVLLTISEPGMSINLSDPKHFISPFYFNIVIALALISLFLVLGKERNAPIPLSTILACVCVCLLTITATPGILLSMGLIILGYAKHEKAISILGSCFLCLFLIAFYYTLPYTLEYKSALLVSTGVVLLAGRFVMQALKWDAQS